MDMSAIEAKEKIQGQRKARKSKRKQRTKEQRIADRANQVDKAIPSEKENEKVTEDTIKRWYSIYSGIPVFVDDLSFIVNEFFTLIQ